MYRSIEVNDLIIFTEKCTAIGAARCKANKTPCKVISIQGGSRVTYLVDVGSGYCIYAHPDDITPFKKQVQTGKEEELCRV